MFLGNMLSAHQGSRTEGLIRAASFGQFDTISDLSAEDLAWKGTGERVITIAARHGHLREISHLITRDLLLLDDALPLRVLVKNGYTQQITPLLSNEFLSMKYSAGSTMYHFAARNGRLKDVTDYLSNESVILRDVSGNTPLHVAAEAGTLKDIPSRFITDGYLNIKNNWGSSVYQSAAATVICGKYRTSWF